MNPLDWRPTRRAVIAAGLVGGFLIASGTKSTSYSPIGLFFVAMLSGMFSPNFISSLARAADAIFGKTDQPPSHRSQQGEVSELER